MEPERNLLGAFLKAHPDDAAALLERATLEESAEFLEKEETRIAAGVLQRMAVAHATACLLRMKAETAGDILSELATDTAAMLLRRMNDAEREAVCARTKDEKADILRLLLRYPQNTAGALMDPTVLSLVEELTAEKALEQVKRFAQQVLYYVYVVDRDRKLVGVLNLKELMMASGEETLRGVMREGVARVDVRADRAAILVHPGWRENPALPVVDENGKFVGALRYETLRTLEEELRETAAPRDPLGAMLALGELYWVGTAQLLQTVLSSSAKGLEPGREAEGGADDGATNRDGG